MEPLAIFCADVGSIRKKRFGWAAVLPDGGRRSGNSIEVFAEQIANGVKQRSKIALGFECPLFVPVRENPREVNSARKGEGNRSWSAGAGPGALATGLVEVLWVMNEVSRLLQLTPRAEFRWSRFLSSDSVLLWEAFVTSDAKGKGHAEDAEIAVDAFYAALPDPSKNSAIEEEIVLSLAGAAALRAGWAEDLDVLSKPCLVIRA